MADPQQERPQTARRAAKGEQTDRARREEEAFARAIREALSYGVEPRGEK